MARMTITDPNPTASQIALGLREGTTLKSVTREQVVSAAHERNVPVRESRIARDNVADVYFALFYRENPAARPSERRDPSTDPVAQQHNRNVSASRGMGRPGF